MAFFLVTKRLKADFDGEGLLELEFAIPYKLYPFVSDNLIDDLLNTSFIRNGDTFVFDSQSFSKEDEEAFDSSTIYSKLDIMWSVLQVKLAEHFKIKFNMQTAITLLRVVFAPSSSSFYSTIIEFSPEHGEEDYIEV